MIDMNIKTTFLATSAAFLGAVSLASTAWAHDGTHEDTTVTQGSTVVSFDNHDYKDTLYNNLNFYDAHNDLSLAISASSNGTPAKIAYSQNGLGVTTGGLDASDINSTAFGSDTLVLTFNKAVSISTLTFSGWDNGLFSTIDQATVSVDGQSQTMALGNNLNSGAFYFDNLIGSTFTLHATGLMSSFRLASVCLQPVITPSIPEPSSYALTLLGLIAVTAARYSRSRRI